MVWRRLAATGALVREEARFRPWLLLDRIDDEVRASLGLVEDLEFDRIFARYVNHVTAAIKQEKVRNATTGREELPDEAMMREVEKILDVGAKAGDGSAREKLGLGSDDQTAELPGVSIVDNRPIVSF